MDTAILSHKCLRTEMTIFNNYENT